MNAALALLCSPREGGVSDTAAALVAAGMADAGVPMRLAALRERALTPCTACGACARPPHACRLAGAADAQGAPDGAEDLFAAIAAAPLLLLAAPIYFYHLPAHAKALIDRAQRFWEARRHHAQQPPAAHRPALALLVAGRPHGAKLFSGALLSCKHFLAPQGLTLRDTRLFRGLETADDLRARPAVTASLRAWGRDWGRALSREAC